MWDTHEKKEITNSMLVKEKILRIISQINLNYITIHACVKREKDKLEIERIELLEPVYNI